MKFFKRNPGILPLTGGIIALISVFTPATTWNPSGSLAIQWMVQLGLTLEPFIEFGLWRTSSGLISLSLLLSGIIIICSIVTIILTIIYKITSKNYNKVKWAQLSLAILITFSTLAWIIMMELFYNSQGYSHWQSYDPNFGVIGPFIGSGLIIISFFLRKN